MSPYPYMSYLENNFSLVQVLKHIYPPYKKIIMDKIMTNNLADNWPCLLLSLSSSLSWYSQDGMLKQAGKVRQKICQLVHCSQLFCGKIGKVSQDWRAFNSFYFFTHTNFNRGIGALLQNMFSSENSPCTVPWAHSCSEWNLVEYL